MATNKKNVFQGMQLAGKSLGLFAIISTGIVAVTYVLTKDQIIENERQALLNSLHMLVSEKQHDNDMYTDILTKDIKTLNFRKKPVTIYRARMNNKPTAAIFSVTAPDGYNGAINLLIGINIKDEVTGVRVISHKETPGLGDGIEIEKSNWITKFDGHSLTNPKESRWRVKKDGGDFDQLTGATITPRAIVKMTRKTLQYFSMNHGIVFSSIINPAIKKNE